MSIMTFTSQQTGYSGGFSNTDEWAFVFYADFGAMPAATNIEVRATFMANAPAGLTNAAVKLHRNPSDLNLFTSKPVGGGTGGTVMQTISIPSDGNWAQYEAPVTTFANPGNLHPIAVSIHVDTSGVDLMEIQGLCIVVRGIA